MTDLAENHQQTAAHFTELVDGTNDWLAPSPVPDWVAADVVEHLIGWLPQVLSNWTDVELPATTGDLPARWQAHAANVQQILDDPATADSPVAQGPFAGSTVATLIDQIYTPDIFMHSWDLARSSGQEPGLDSERAQQMLAGMEPIEEMLRASGQYGRRQHTNSTDPIDQLIAFIGRDPAWRP